MIKPSLGSFATSSFKTHPRYRGCVAHYAMIEGGGTTLYNVAQYRNDGTLTNGVAWTTGQFGHCLSFDGVDDYVDLGTSTLFDFPNQLFSISFWTKTSTLPAGSSYYIARRQIGFNEGGWFARLDSTGAMEARIIDGVDTNAASRTSTSTTLADGTWKHIAVIYKTDTVTLANNDVTIYINTFLDQGARTDSGFGPYSPGTHPLVLGVLSDLFAGSWYTGLIDELRIYDRELTIGEIISLYTNPYLEFPRKVSVLSGADISSSSRRMRLGVGI